MKPHIDPYLEAVFGPAQDALPRQGGLEHGVHYESFGLNPDPQPAAPPADPGPWVPMLLRVRERWAAYPGVRELARVGSVAAVEATREGRARLALDPDVLSVEASRPGGGFDAAEAAPGVAGTEVQRPQVPERGERCLIALIDSGIDILHGAFRNARGEPRFLAVWDQTDPTGPSPEKVNPARYPNLRQGTLHAQAAIAGYLSAGKAPDSLRDPRGHGTHVASVAAGRAIGSLPDGMAPDAPLVVVIPQLEPEPGQRASLGYSASHAQALAFIGALATEKGLPVVVNMSSGMNAGAHDGTSLLECAFDEFTSGGRAPGRVVVKSAGNEQTRSGHASVQATSGVVSVDWDSAPVDRPEDYVEAWFDSGLDLQFTLLAPSGAGSQPVDLRSPFWKGQLDGAEAWLALRRFHVDNGDACLQIGLSHPKGRIPAGTWKLKVRGLKLTGHPAVDLWAERTGKAYISFQNGRSQQGTLSVPGTARSVITVGAYDATSLEVFESSSHGPTRDARSKPDLVAPGVEVRGAKAGGTTHQEAGAQSGTSVAAPFVSGAIALLLSAAKKGQGALPNAQQARAMLVRTCDGYTGQWHPGNGFGRLDAEAALKAS